MKIKEDYQALLTAPIDWDKANLFRPSDNIAYIGIDAQAIRQAKIGTTFRCYYAPVQGILNGYRLVLFQVGAYFEPISKKSSRVYYELAKIDFAENIWGKQL